jgi:hypothetical protein
MWLSVTRAGRGIFYFAGELDEYNFELLREQAARLGPASGAELRIKLDPREESALRSRAGEWLGKLANAGVSVRLERARTPRSAQARPAKAAENRPLAPPAAPVKDASLVETEKEIA